MKKRLWHSYEEDGIRDPERMSCEVFEPDEPEYTGLLDAQGRPLFRQREKLGFAIPEKKP